MKTVEENTIGGKIRTMRVFLNLKQHHLGVAADVTPTQIGRYESNENDIPAAKLAILAALLGKPMEYFTSTEELPAPPKTMEDLFDVIKRQEKEIESIKANVPLDILEALSKCNDDDLIEVRITLGLESEQAEDSESSSSSEGKL